MYPGHLNWRLNNAKQNASHPKHAKLSAYKFGALADMKVIVLAGTKENKILGEILEGKNIGQPILIQIGAYTESGNPCKKRIGFETLKKHCKAKMNDQRDQYPVVSARL